MRIALVHSRVREEERLLHDAFVALGVTVELIDARGVVIDTLDPGPWSGFDVVMD
ncbi:MAG: 30S ribosomal protein S6--L-glutamate ligase, partial [Methylacidiphilales bacterium]|nr:30S ribosomal protein S6--L-glutamate ligase [Candidatus Methylacidiphilales bacterium]